MSATVDSRPYRIPSSLRDLVMLDLLELTGSTTATAELLTMSQPSVSRRYRSVARDLSSDIRFWSSGDTKTGPPDGLLMGALRLPLDRCFIGGCRVVAVGCGICAA